MDAAKSATVEGSRESSRAKSLPVDARAIQGVWLLLASLGVFFFASILLLVAYAASRLSSESGYTQPVHLPASILPSTLLLAGVSIFLELATRAAKRDRFSLVRNYTFSAAAFAALFIVVQSDGLTRLIHSFAESSNRSESVYGFVFVLVFLHAAHVLGGAVGLFLTARKTIQNEYDHERNFGLRFCTLYWHFLDLVWVVLIISFLITAWLVRQRVAP